MTKLTAELIAELTADDTKIVDRVLGRDVSRADLTHAFDRVADKANWKNPIDAVVDCNDYERALIERAIVFFAGCKATFSPRAGAALPRCRYRVRAAGYYLAIAYDGGFARR